MSKKDFDKYIKLFLETEVKGLTITNFMKVGYIEGKVMFIEIDGRTATGIFEPSTVKMPEYDKWQAFLAAQNQIAPPTIGDAYQTSFMWQQIPTEKAFIQSTIQGIAIAMVFAFIVLLIATRNVILSLISIFCVSVIIISVLAVMVMLGWQLGVAESIAVVLLIGFSVDYVIHLSHVYQHSPVRNRADKMQQAYREMGVSILSGAITTFGAGFFLLGTVFIFFQKFGILICTTITIAFVISMLYFGALCHVCGPQDGFGDLFKPKNPNVEAAGGESKTDADDGNQAI